MIIRENKIIDQFPTPKHQQSGCRFENCAVIMAGWTEAPSQS